MNSKISRACLLPYCINKLKVQVKSNPLISYLKHLSLTSNNMIWAVRVSLYNVIILLLTDSVCNICRLLHYESRPRWMEYNENSLRYTHWFHVEGTLKNFKIGNFCIYLLLSSQKYFSQRNLAEIIFHEVNLEPFLAKILVYENLFNRVVYGAFPTHIIMSNL